MRAKRESKRERKKRLKLEAEILYYLWSEGATPLHRLTAALEAKPEEIQDSVKRLAQRQHIYKLFEPPEDHDSSVYYLTARTRDRLSKLFRGDPRYHMKLLWYALREEESTPGITIT